MLVVCVVPISKKRDFLLQRQCTFDIHPNVYKNKVIFIFVTGIQWKKYVFSSLISFKHASRRPSTVTNTFLQRAAFVVTTNWLVRILDCSANNMVPSRLAIAVLLALVASTAEAFAPSRHASFTSVTKTKSSVTASVQEEILTQAEEDLHFGGPSPELKGRNRYQTKTGLILPDNSNPPNPLDHSKDPLVNKLRTMRETISSCPAIWKELAENCPNRKAVIDEHLCDTKIDLTFAQMEDKIRRSASAFQELGVTKGVNVAVLGENSAMWLIVDHGIQLAGGASAVRGADAPLDELRYIYEHSDSAGIAVLQDVGLLKNAALLVDLPTTMSLRKHVVK